MGLSQFFTSNKEPTQLSRLGLPEKKSVSKYKAIITPPQKQFPTMLHFQCFIRTTGYTLPEAICGLWEAFTNSWYLFDLTRVASFPPPDTLSVQGSKLGSSLNHGLPGFPRLTVYFNNRLLTHHKTAGGKLRAFSVSSAAVADIWLQRTGFFTKT